MQVHYLFFIQNSHCPFSPSSLLPLPLPLSPPPPSLSPFLSPFLYFLLSPCPTLPLLLSPPPPPPPTPQNPHTVMEIERLREEGEENELQIRLGSRLVFGTAGLRAKMGAGYCYMNDLTIIQTTQVKHCTRMCNV